MYREDLESLVKTLIPSGFLMDWLVVLGKTYLKTWRQARKEYAPPEAKDVLPHIRRAKLEGEFRRLAKLHSLDESTYMLNDGGNQFHSEVRSGDLLLTQSATRSPYEVVRQACFRGTLARYNQGDLFSNTSPVTEKYLFGILTHGPDQKDFPWVPAFARLVIPDSDQKNYVTNINLFRLCEFDPQQYLEVAEIETVPPTQPPSFLPGVIREQDRE